MEETEHAHTWGDWELRRTWPAQEDGQPAVRSWIRECEECDAALYVRIEGEAPPGEAEEGQGMLFE